MRLVRTFERDESANEAAQVLESVGIPAFVEPSRGPRYRTLPSPARVLVYLENHYEDARVVLDDPGHEVREPVDIAGFNRFRENFDHSVVMKWSLLGPRCSFASCCWSWARRMRHLHCLPRRGADPVSSVHMVARYRELVPEADVTELPRIGHYPQVEAPEAVLAAYLEFRGRVGA